MVGTYRDLYFTKSFFRRILVRCYKAVILLAMSLGSFCGVRGHCGFSGYSDCGLVVVVTYFPIAYAAGILPSTAQYRGSEWWKTFALRVLYANNGFLFKPHRAYFQPV